MLILAAHPLETDLRSRGIMTSATPRQSRRRFLRQTTFGLLALWGGGLHTFVRMRQQPHSMIPSGLVFFSDQEYAIVQAVARRLIGSDSRIGSEPGQSDVALRADRFLAEAELDVQEQFHQLLVVFNAPVFTFLFDFRLSSFLAMQPDQQDTYLQDWMTSTLAFRRTAFQALKRLCASMYYTDSVTWKDIEYTGLFLPGERP